MMMHVDHSSIKERTHWAGANVLTLLLTLAFPPQAANAALYISSDMGSAYDHLRKELHSWVSFRVLRRLR